MRGAGALVRVEVPATSANLGPGFDCLGLALDICNMVEIEEAPGGRVKVEIAGEGAGDLAADAANLVATAAERVFSAAGRRPAGFHLRLENAIPVARGLGSSSAAIVGGMVAANALLGAPLSNDEILQLAFELEGHPDNVAPALLGGLTVACVSGSRALALRLDPPAGLPLAVLVPERPLATAEARRVLPTEIPRADAIFNVQRACLLLAALGDGRTDLLAEALQDRLHQPYRAALLPGLAEVLAAARRPGLLGACLSGSGSSVLCFLDPQASPEARQQGARALAAVFEGRDIPCRVLFTAPSAHGARLVAR